MSTQTCRGPECTRPIHNLKRQLCRAHAKQWHTNGALKPLAAPRGIHAVPRVCEVDGCGRDVVAKGLCNMHRQRMIARGTTEPARPGETVCQGPGCDRRAKTAGLCPTHYVQQRRGKPLTPIGSTKRTGNGQPCAFPGCDRPRGALQWCKTHREQERKGRPMRPIGQYHRDLAAAAEERRARGEARPKRVRKPKPTMPDGWNRKTKPAKEKANVDPTATMSFLVPTLPPEIAAKARRNLIAMGADDLLDILGLDGAA